MEENITNMMPASGQKEDHVCSVQKFCTLEAGQSRNVPSLVKPLNKTGIYKQCK